MTSTLEPDRTTSYTEQYGLGTGLIPVSGYASQDYYEREIDRVFKRTWLSIGRTVQIPKPGDYFVKNLAFARTSILVTHGRDGTIRAFHNVCSHRCNELAWNNRGNARRLQCGFHGWTFGLDGALVSVPDEESFFDLDKSALGLTPVACEVWEGYIFINLAPEPQETLTEYLGGHLDKFDGYPFQQFTRTYDYVGVVNCNWKIARDAFAENYHLPTVHRYLFKKAYTSPENPYNHNFAYSNTKYHGQHSIYINPKYEPSPLEALAFGLSGMDSIMVKPEDCDELRVPGMNPLGRPDWSGEQVQIFPNTIMLMFVGFSMWFTFTPLGVDRCLMEMQQAVRPHQNAKQRWAQEIANTTFQFSALEDFSTLERTQTVIASRARKHFVLQDQEVQVRLLHHWIQEMAGPYPVEWTR